MHPLCVDLVRPKDRRTDVVGFRFGMGVFADSGCPVSTTLSQVTNHTCIFRLALAAGRVCCSRMQFPSRSLSKYSLRLPHLRMTFLSAMLDGVGRIGSSLDRWSVKREHQAMCPRLAVD